MKKALSLLLTLGMVLGMTITGFAADSTSNLTIKTTNNHTYKVYQLLKGDVSNLTNGTGTLSNVEKGANLKADTTADAFVAAIKDKTGVALSDEAFKYVTGDPAYTVDGTGSDVEKAVVDGYYVVVDTTTTSDTVSRYMVAVVGPTTMTPKSTSTPTMEKKVKDTNDSTGETSDWQDSADYDIGDAVPFKLTAVLPDSYNDYHTYYMSFNDTLSEGLTLQASTIKVSVAGTQLANDQYYIYGGQNTFKVVIYDLKTVAPSAKNGDVVTVEYSAILNDKAVLGAKGNPNVANLTYSNNPNTTTQTTPKNGDTPGTPDKPGTPDTPKNPGEPNTPDNPGTTPDDKVIVFTYKVTVDKVKETLDGEALKGAGFTLYKYNAASTATDKYEAVGSEVKGADMTTFEWKGLDDGQYKLVETTTPAGYNTISPQEFKVTAEHDVTSQDPKLTKLSGDKVSGDITFTRITTDTDDYLNTKVVNKAGSVLPSTGGMGTKLFYLFGTILVLGAGVLLFTRKRMA